MNIVTPPYTQKTVDLSRAIEITPEPINWIWQDWLAQGKFHLLAGAPGTGKTHLALDMAATVSVGSNAGRYWPDGAFSPKSNVIIWSGEDGIEDTIVPRLHAAGADTSCIYILRGVQENQRYRAFDFKKDGCALEAKIREIGHVHLIIIDPIVQTISGNLNNNASVRNALEPLVRIAETYQCAVLGITHLTKGSKRKDPLDRIAGSHAFVAVSRIVMVAAKIINCPDESASSRNLLVRVKSNIGQDDGGLEYTLKSAPGVTGAFISSSRVLWSPEPLSGSGRDLLAQAENLAAPANESAKEKAVSFLQKVLAMGPLPSLEVEAMAKAENISKATLRRAKDALGVLSHRQNTTDENGRLRWNFFLQLPQNTVNGTGLFQSMQTYAPACYAPPPLFGGMPFQGMMPLPVPMEQYEQHGQGGQHCSGPGITEKTANLTNDSGFRGVIDHFCAKNENASKMDSNASITEQRSSYDELNVLYHGPVMGMLKSCYKSESNAPEILEITDVFDREEAIQEAVRNKIEDDLQIIIEENHPELSAEDVDNMVAKLINDALRKQG